ncbi:sensor histidine kinase [Streptomyces termitum]|uniref:sensor histidine kinase n=1 Tax=Streptomyces termitum TaxID=67368 RepID=UPI0037AAF562
MTGPAGGWGTLIGPGFAEALQQGLDRVARSAPPRGGVARALVPVEAGGPAGPLREHVEAVLRRFEAALPGVLPPEDRDAPVQEPLRRWAGAVLTAAYGPASPPVPGSGPGAGSGTPGVPGPGPAGPHLPLASALLMECAVLQMLESGCLDGPSVRALGEALRAAGPVERAGPGACCWGERRRIARELHDEVARGVTAARVLVERYATEPPVPQDTGRLLAAGHALREADLRLRALVRGERSRAALPALGSAVRRFAAGLAPEGVRLSVRTTGDEGLVPDARRRDLYLVVCEALRNSFAHADARQVKVVVRCTRWWAYASVEDDGRGFDSGRALRPGHGHQGFRSMAERMEDIGGRLTVSSSPLEGTLVEAHLPLRPRAEGARTRSTHV